MVGGIIFWPRGIQVMILSFTSSTSLITSGITGQTASGAYTIYYGGLHIINRYLSLQNGILFPGCVFLSKTASNCQMQFQTSGNSANTSLSMVRILPCLFVIFVNNIYHFV